LISALATDLYEIAMAAGYQHVGMSRRCTFELFVRKLPPHRGYLVAAGLDQALDYLENLRFTSEEIAYLRTVPALSPVPDDFFNRVLPALRFRGDVWAVREGEPVFAGEPILRVSAAATEAQLVETALLAIVTFQTSIASKAARVVQAAGGRAVIEFGSRRAHGLQAALFAARAACLAGCEGTSNVEAGYRFGVPVSGTMAHSWVMAFERELDAFTRYLELFGERTTLLIDTYDTLGAARSIVAARLKPSAVRLDSGDLLGLSREVRRIFDEGGLGATKILASGDLDEDSIATLIAAGAPIDAFGVGTALSTSIDAPALGGVYKLVEVEHEGTTLPVVKLSAGKKTLAGAKQVWRVVEDGIARRDWIGLEHEAPPSGARALLQPVMRAGRRLAQSPPVSALREGCLAAVAELPPRVRRLSDWQEHEVATTTALERVTAEARRRSRS
jgi:nicotinate phosphoribosyltransferase